MTTQPVVQPDVVSVGTTLPAVETLPEPSPEEIRISELITKKIAEETAKFATSLEAARREIQSTKDRATTEIAAATRRARLAEGALGATRTQLQQLDPDVAKEMELAEYRAREAGRAGIEQEEAVKQQQATFHGQFYSNISQFITGLGVDPNDSRIDWGSDSPNYLEAQRRVLESVSKIQKEKIQTTQSGLEKRLKDLEAKIKQANIEVNAVETAASVGAVAGSDAEFVKKFGDGTIPISKANIDRYNKITKSY